MSREYPSPEIFRRSQVNFEDTFILTSESTSGYTGNCHLLYFFLIADIIFYCIFRFYMKLQAFSYSITHASYNIYSNLY